MKNRNGSRREMSPQNAFINLNSRLVEQKKASRFYISKGILHLILHPRGAWRVAKGISLLVGRVGKGIKAQQSAPTFTLPCPLPMREGRLTGN